MPASGENAYINALRLRGWVKPPARERVDACVRHVNIHGGVLGHRKLVLVLVEHSSPADDSNSGEQTECADRTQDHHAFVRVDLITYDPD